MNDAGDDGLPPGAVFDRFDLDFVCYDDEVIFVHDSDEIIANHGRTEVLRFHKVFLLNDAPGKRFYEGRHLIIDDVREFFVCSYNSDYCLSGYLGNNMQPLDDVAHGNHVRVRIVGYKDQIPGLIS